MLILSTIIVDYNTNIFNQTRYYLSTALYPIHLVANFPISLYKKVKNKIYSNNYLIVENEKLNHDILILKYKIQKQEFLQKQNNLLQELLHASNKIEEDFLITNIVGIDPQHISQKVVVDCGNQDNVCAGQAVVDANGIFGQIIELSRLSSRVLLISDTMTRVPVQNNRTGYRAIAAGTGDYQFVDLLQVPTTADFHKGDLIVSSGIDNIYPTGYPVGIVSKVVSKENQPFLDIQVKLLANLTLQQPLLIIVEKAQNDAL